MICKKIQNSVFFLKTLIPAVTASSTLRSTTYFTVGDVMQDISDHCHISFAVKCNYYKTEEYQSKVSDFPLPFKWNTDCPEQSGRCNKKYLFDRGRRLPYFQTIGVRSQMYLSLIRWVSILAGTVKVTGMECSVTNLVSRHIYAKGKQKVD